MLTTTRRTTGKTAALVDFFESILYVRGPKEPHGKVLADLGFGYPAEIEALIPSDNVLAELSLEPLELLDGVDVVIVGDFEGKGELTGDPLYQALDIVEQGRVVPGVEPVEGALYWASVLSLPFAIEHLTPMRAAAVDADPATDVPPGPRPLTAHPRHVTSGTVGIGEGSAPTRR